MTQQDRTNRQDRKSYRKRLQVLQPRTRPQLRKPRRQISNDYSRRRPETLGRVNGERRNSTRRRIRGDIK